MEKLNSPIYRNRPGRKRLNAFQTAENRSSLVKQLMEKERAELDARTEKLRALRLDKEEADRQFAAANPSPAAKPKMKRVAY